MIINLLQSLGSSSQLLCERLQAVTILVIYLFKTDIVFCFINLLPLSEKVKWSLHTP